MKLVVLAGAKKGASVPIKKSSFVIGRSRECSLRAGSEAISRKHCELVQSSDGPAIRDLGSRNGTLVNDVKIEGLQPLKNGDTVTVGPLRFRFECEPALKKVKAPKVRNVGEAVARAANKPSDSSGGFGEDDISQWLLGEPASASPSFAETLVMRNDETQTGEASLNSPTAETQPITTPEAPEEADGEEAVSEEAADGDKKKKKPGKLPFRPPEPEKAKDSREAAANVLRDMARRR